MILFRRVLYSSNETDCASEADKLNKDHILQKYTNFKEYFGKLWLRNREWCLFSIDTTNQRK